MADQPKKRDIKDLKARLGRTVAPTQKQAAAVAPPTGLGGAVAPPGGVVPPSVPGVTGPARPAGGVAAPPFMQPTPAQPPDPFASAAVPAGPREVRIVVDEKPVEDAEVGRKKRLRNYILIAAGIVVGLVLGFGFGSTMGDRNTYALAVQDGKDIYAKVREASDTVNRAKRLVDQAVTAARGGGGKAAAVDYEAIEQLRALKKPIDADAFSRKRYSAFNPGTVDALFQYYNNVQNIWERFTSLSARTLGPQQRRLLDNAARAAGEMATQQTGCVPSVVEEQWFCGLVFVHPPAEQTEAPPTKVMVSTTPTGRTFEKTIYTGAEDQNLTASPDNFVILTHTIRSVGVLGQPASAFAEYQRDLMQIKQLMDQTVEVQGRLETELGNIARLE